METLVVRDTGFCLGYRTLCSGARRYNKAKYARAEQAVSRKKALVLSEHSHGGRLPRRRHIR